jgi:membrane protease YdiL (CAAX protease family)
MDPTPASPLPPWPAWPARRLLLFILLVLAGDYLAQLLVYSLCHDMFLSVLAGGLLGVVLPCRLLARGGGGTLRRDFHLDRVDSGTIVAAVVAAAAALLPTSVLAGLSARIHPIDPQWLEYYREHLPASGLGIVVAAITAVLIAPLAEELLFRGLIYRLARRAWGAWPAAVVSSLIFGLIHGEPWYLFGLVGLGLILATLYETTGSLLAPFIAHALHNAVSLFLLIRDPDQIAADPALETTDWILLAASVAVLAVTALLLSRRTRRLGAD